MQLLCLYRHLMIQKNWISFFPGSTRNSFRFPLIDAESRDQTCVVSIRQVLDELVGTGQPGSSEHLLIWDVLAAVFDVLLHRASKQHAVLAHHSNLYTDRTERKHQWQFIIALRMVYNEAESRIKLWVESKKVLISVIRQNEGAKELQLDTLKCIHLNLG